MLWNIGKNFENLHSILSFFWSMNSEPARLWNNSVFTLSHSSNCAVSPQTFFHLFQYCVIFDYFFFIRCDQVPFSDHFTRSRPRTHCSKDDQSCKNIAWCFDKLWLLCLRVCTFSAHIHTTMQVTGFLLILRPVHTIAFQNGSKFCVHISVCAVFAGPH